MAPVNQSPIKAAAATTAAIGDRSPTRGPGFVTVDINRKPMHLPIIDSQTPATTDSTIIIRQQQTQNPEDFPIDDGKFHQFAPTDEEKKQNKHLNEICHKFIVDPTPEELKALAKCPGQASTAKLAIVANTTSSNTASVALPLITTGEHNDTKSNLTTRYNHNNTLQNRAYGIDNADAFATKPAAAMPFTIQIDLAVFAIAIVCIIFGIMFYKRRQQNKKQAVLLPRHNNDLAFDFGVEDIEDAEEKYDFLYEWQPQNASQ